MTPSPGRGNGRVAASYVALTDLEPHLADLVLELLGDAGIAAYASPATSESVTELLRPRVDRVLDRVHVDTVERARAQQVLQANLPALRAAEGAGESVEPARPAAAARAAGDDDVWASLVAAFNAPSAPDRISPWPAAEDLVEPPPARPAGAPAPRTGEDRRDHVRPGQQDRRAGPPAGPSDATGAEASPVLRPAQGDWTEPPAPAAPAPAPEDEHHYVPPPPPPLPRGDTITRWAWVGLVGGPLLLLLAAVLRIEVEDWMLLVGVFAFVGGFVTLVARMKDGPDDDPDDGAVV